MAALLISIAAFLLFISRTFLLASQAKTKCMCMVLSFRLTILASISVHLSIIQKHNSFPNILSNKNDVLIRLKYGHLSKLFPF